MGAPCEHDHVENEKDFHSEPSKRKLASLVPRSAGHTMSKKQRILRRCSIEDASQHEGPSRKDGAIGEQQKCSFHRRVRFSIDQSQQSRRSNCKSEASRSTKFLEEARLLKHTIRTFQNSTRKYYSNHDGLGTKSDGGIDTRRTAMPFFAPSISSSSLISPYCNWGGYSDPSSVGAKTTTAGSSNLSAPPPSPSPPASPSRADRLMRLMHQRAVFVEQEIQRCEGVQDIDPFRIHQQVSHLSSWSSFRAHSKAMDDAVVADRIYRQGSRNLGALLPKSLSKRKQERATPIQDQRPIAMTVSPNDHPKFQQQHSQVQHQQHSQRQSLCYFFGGAVMMERNTHTEMEMMTHHSWYNVMMTSNDMNKSRQLWGNQPASSPLSW